MNTWMKVTLAVSVPTMSFLVLQDTIQGMYGPNRELPLSYVVVEPEEPISEEEIVEEEAAVEQEPATVDDASPVETVEADAVPADPEAVDEDTASVMENEVTDDTVADAPLEGMIDDTLMAALTPDEMKAGEAAARACASCHQLARDRNAVGPHLVGLAGRPIGGVDGFRYSDALNEMNAEGAVWDAANLQAWLEDPDAFAEGTKMMFNVRDAEERRLIAGWLTQREE